MGDRGLNVGATLLGAGVVVGGTLAVAAVAVKALGGGSRALLSPGFLGTVLAAGLLLTCGGGALAARLARRRELTHAAAAAALSVAFGTGLTIFGVGFRTPWYLGVAYVLVFPVALLGGWMGQRWNRRGRAEGPGALEGGSRGR
jgi:hypothetical protein